MTNDYFLLSRVTTMTRSVVPGERILHLEREASWPDIRSNPTVLVPEIEFGELLWKEGKYAHYYELEVLCPHCDKTPFTLDGSMRRYSEVCGYRPLEPVSDYEELCEDCGHAIAWHGCIGVHFCVECGGEIRGFTECSINRFGQPWGLKGGAM